MNSNNINGSQNRPPSSAGMMYYVPQPNMTNNGNMFPPPNSHPDRMGPPMINPRSNSGMMLNRPQLKPVEPINTNLKIPELTPPCTTNTSAISSNTSSRASSPMCRLVHDPKTMQNEV